MRQIRFIGMIGGPPAAFYVIDPVARLAWRVKGKDPAAVDLGVRGGRASWAVREKDLTPAQMRVLGMKGAAARWGNKRKLTPRTGAKKW